MENHEGFYNHPYFSSFPLIEVVLDLIYFILLYHGYLQRVKGTYFKSPLIVQYAC